jgi:chorismate-pyruvate lyase
MPVMPKSAPVKFEPAPDLAVDSNSIAYPLNDFYARNAQLMPPLEEIDPEEVPAPYKSLLVHQHDMTSTLENHHGGRIHLRLIGKLLRGSEYFREVALLVEGTEKPVEFGAIKINLDLFPETARRQILEEHWPLGHILKESGIKFTSEPRAFLRVASDKLINSVLNLSGAHLLYGRRNTLFDRSGQSLAEIVEILPPHTRAK